MARPGLRKRLLECTLAVVVTGGAGSFLHSAAADAPPATSPSTAPSTAPTTQPSPPPSPATQPAPPAPGPNGHIVQKGNIARIIQTEGIFQPDGGYELKLALKAFGGPLTINKIAAPGSAVKKGDVLLELDPTPYQWAMTGAENDLKGAEANLAKAQSDVDVGAKMDALSLRMNEDGVKNADDAVKWYESVDGPQMQVTADLLVKQAQDAVDDQGDELDQLRKMYKDDELTSSTADIVVKRAVRSADRAKTMLKMQQERRDKTKGFDYPINHQKVLDADAQAKHLLETSRAAQSQAATMRQAALAVAKIAVTQATKRMSELKEDQALLTVKSPEDGAVEYGTIVDGNWFGGDSKAMKQGEKLAPGQIVLRVYTPGKLKVIVGLPEAQAFWIENGMKARVTPAAFPQGASTATCGVPEVGPHGNPATVGWQLSLDLADVDRRIMPGMRGNVYLDCGGAESVVMVPTAAVTGGKVSVRKDGKVTERDVVLGKSDGANVEIRQGLSEGEEVVLPGGKK